MANVLFVLVFTGLIFECFSTENQARPGIRLRVTNKGLQYGKKYSVVARGEIFILPVHVLFHLFKLGIIVSFELITFAIPLFKDINTTP